MSVILSLRAHDGAGGGFGAAAVRLLLFLLILAAPAASRAATCGPEGAALMGPQSDTQFESRQEPYFPPPASAVMLFDTGAPRTNPYATCGSCYAWSSTYYQSASNFDFTGRKFRVPAGSYVTALRFWWAFGNEGPLSSTANLGGTAGDFSRISVDLYDASGTGGLPGVLLANLSGTWAVLDAGTHYREFTLTTPFLFTGTAYYAALRAETGKPDYQATILWLMCAPHDTLMDAENYKTSGTDTGGWRTYGLLSPCPADQDFGLQVLGHLTSDTVDLTPGPDCITPAHTCNMVTVDYDRASGPAVRGYSVKIALSSNLMLCGDIGSSIVEGGFLRDYPGGQTHFEARDNGDGTCTVDCALLGGVCGPTGGGTLFTVSVAKKPGGAEGDATVSPGQVVMRDCGNHTVAASPGAAAHITIDTAAPSAIGDLAATQVKHGYSTGGKTTRVQLTFSAPSGASAVEVYRAAFGHYPEYDDQGGAPPVMPGAWPPGSPWALTGVTGSGQTDSVGTRDFYYYVAYAKDACGNWSAVSNRTAGTLNYFLGDVSSSGGDNRVDGVDVSALGAHYGITLTHVGDPYNYLDVGPTTDWSVDALPVTDDRVDFEDLMVFAMNFGQVGSRPPVVPGETPVLAWIAPSGLPGNGGTFTAQLVLQGNHSAVKGLHARVEFDRARLEVSSIEEGAWLHDQGQVFFKSLDEASGLALDAAMLGSGLAFQGSGVVARVTFRMRSASPVPRMTVAELRDRENHTLAGVGSLPMSRPSESTGLSSRVELVGARPDPFQGSSSIVFRLPETMPVAIRIYDVAGRLVRVVQDGVLPAGEHVITWNGRDASGHDAGPGIFFYRFRAGGEEQMHKLLRQR